MLEGLVPTPEEGVAMVDRREELGMALRIGHEWLNEVAAMDYSYTPSRSRVPRVGAPFLGR